MISKPVKDKESKSIKLLFAMVEAYWNIGKSIIEEQGGNEKAEYGTGLLKELSKQMTQDFGKGFTVANLKNMRQFYLTFPNGYALRSELSWTHYRLLMRVENENAREFYMQEAVKSQWSTRQFERQINSFFYERLLSSKNKEQVAEEIQTLYKRVCRKYLIYIPVVLGIMLKHIRKSKHGKCAGNGKEFGYYSLRGEHYRCLRVSGSC